MNLKKLALAFFAVTTTGAAVVVASVSNSNSVLTLASECDHEGNHYEKREASQSSSGTKEYWVCCKCHQHFLAQPEPKDLYTWEDAGIAPIISDINDDRYIPNGTVVTVDDLKALGFGSVTQNADGTFGVGKYDPTKRADGNKLVIPENVTSFEGNTFHGANMEYVVIPKSMTSTNGGCFNKANITTVYFVGTKFNISGTVKYTYELQGKGWDYVNGTPTPIKQ